MIKLLSNLLILFVTYFAISSIVFATEVRSIENTIPFTVFKTDHSHDLNYPDQIQISPVDEQIGAVLSRDHELALVDFTHQVAYWRKQLSGFRGPLEFSHDGKILAVRDGSDLVLLQINTGEEFRRWSMSKIDRTIHGSDSAPLIAHFSQDDSGIMIADGQNVFLITVSTGFVEQKFLSTSVPNFLTFIEAMQWSVDEHYLFVVTWHGLVVFQVTSGAYLRTVDLGAIGHLDLAHVRAIKVTQDGAFTVIANHNFVSIFDNQSQKLIRTVLAAASDLTDIVMTNDQCCFITTSLDGSSRVYDIASGEQITRLDDTRPSSERLSFTSVASTSKNDLIVTGDHLGNVRVWHPNNLP